jgi:hypothetical protein
MPPERRRRLRGQTTRPLTFHPDIEFHQRLREFADEHCLTISGAMHELGRRALGMSSLLAQMDEADGR